MAATAPTLIVPSAESAGGWLRFERPVRVLSCAGPDGVRELLDQVNGALGRGLYAAGFLTYEAAPAFDPAFRVHAPTLLPVAYFGLFEGATPVDTPVVGPDRPLELGAWQAGTARQEYDAALARIRAYLRAGDTYQVNYTLRLRTSFAGDPRDLQRTLFRAQPAACAAFVDTPDFTICSASPELFFRREGNILSARPMKGTARRGLTWDQDRAAATRLHGSAKDRAENVMIVDMVRNDMGRVADPGSVEATRLFEIERYPTVLQMTSTVTCRTETGLSDILGALFPCASITGAPKVRTMQIIHELEPDPRGVYTGCIGYAGPDRRALFNVAIRTVTLDKRGGQAEYGVGGGIVWDSTTGDEYEECRTKASVLTTPMPAFELLETLLWEPDTGFLLLDGHLERLTRSAAYFAFPLDRSRIVAALQAAVRPVPPGIRRVRLRLAPDGAPRVETAALTPPPHPGPWRVALAPGPIDRDDRFLYHKTTHRRVYEEARATAPGHDDVVLWNRDGEVTESTIANVIVRRGDRWVTPPVTSGLLGGVFRGHLLATGEIEEGRVTVEELRNAQTFQLVNSVRRRVEAVLVDRQS